MINQLIERNDLCILLVDKSAGAYNLNCNDKSHSTL